MNEYAELVDVDVAVAEAAAPVADADEAAPDEDFGDLAWPEDDDAYFSAAEL